jgi:glycosyltransferase involved in cell wall biosynthesis
MRIGVMLPGTFSVGNRGNGVAEQAGQQAQALERRGHTVLRLNPWEWQDERSLDVLHFFVGGATLDGVTRYRQLSKPGVLVFSPIIDSNQPLVSYRLAAALGSLSARLLTIPGMLRSQANSSDVVICRSAHESQRLAAGLGIGREKLEVVLNGCTAPAVSAADAGAVRAALALPEDFLLHVSAFTQERKNVLRLAEAAESLGYPLVIAGTSAPGPVLRELQNRARNSNRIRVLGYVDAAVKHALFETCRVFCLPSYHEGTGLAALEAAAQGANIVITRNGGPPDYFLDHAEYVDPYSVAGIRAAIARAWTRPRNEALRAHVTQSLTWDQSALRLESVYAKRLEAKSPLANAREPDRVPSSAPDSMA